MSKRVLGTFEGVFTPTILTIVGVIMYLRLGWVVGTVGLGAAIVIILLSHVATVTTGLALSSMTTNVRIGAGGFYSLISRSLGIEAGGAPAGDLPPTAAAGAVDVASVGGDIGAAVAGCGA